MADPSLALVIEKQENGDEEQRIRFWIPQRLLINFPTRGRASMLSVTWGRARAVPTQPACSSHQTPGKKAFFQVSKVCFLLFCVFCHWNSEKDHKLNKHGGKTKLLVIRCVQALFSPDMHTFITAKYLGQWKTV